MTAKEKLRKAIEDLSELEAEQTLAFIADHRADPVIEYFENAPEDDEPLTPGEEASLDGAWAEYKRGQAVPLEDVRRELD